MVRIEGTAPDPNTIRMVTRAAAPAAVNRVHTISVQAISALRLEGTVYVQRVVTVCGAIPVVSYVPCIVSGLRSNKLARCPDPAAILIALSPRIAPRCRGR